MLSFSLSELIFDVVVFVAMVALAVGYTVENLDRNNPKYR